MPHRSHLARRAGQRTTTRSSGSADPPAGRRAVRVREGAGRRDEPGLLEVDLGEGEAAALPQPAQPALELGVDGRGLADTARRSTRGSGRRGSGRGRRSRRPGRLRSRPARKAASTSSRRSGSAVSRPTRTPDSVSDRASSPALVSRVSPIVSSVPIERISAVRIGRSVEECWRSIGRQGSTAKRYPGWYFRPGAAFDRAAGSRTGGKSATAFAGPPGQHRGPTTGPGPQRLTGSSTASSRSSGGRASPRRGAPAGDLPDGGCRLPVRRDAAAPRGVRRGFRGWLRADAADLAETPLSHRADRRGRIVPPADAAEAAAAQAEADRERLRITELGPRLTAVDGIAGRPRSRSARPRLPAPGPRGRGALPGSPPDLRRHPGAARSRRARRADRRARTRAVADRDRRPGPAGRSGRSAHLWLLRRGDDSSRTVPPAG